MKKVLETENWVVGWTEVGNYKLKNKTTEQKMTVPRNIMRTIAEDVMNK